MIVHIFVIIHGFSAFKNYVYEAGIPKHELGPDFDPTLSEDFCAELERLIKYSITNPLQRHLPFIDKSKYIFCLDCPRKNIWRREIYPAYKLDRDLRSKDKDLFNVGKIFNYSYSYILPKICDEFKAMKIMCNCAEGDDVIAVLTKYFLDNTSNDVVIISCDKDMVQLWNDRVSIYTVEGTERIPCEELSKALKKPISPDVTAGDFLLFKILIGDTADRNT